MGYSGLAAFGAAAEPDVLQNLPQTGGTRALAILFSAT
eukprot:SAG22_NODE_8180_length_676_cov_1.279029_1_plen_37_part_10